MTAALGPRSLSPARLATAVAPQPSTDLPIAWSPQEGFQRRFCEHGAFEVLGGGAAGPGKTSCLIAKAAQYAQHPNARVIFLRTVYKDLLDVRDRMQVIYPQWGATWNSTDSRWIFPSGAPVMLAHGATMNEIGAFLGPEYSAVIWDELSLVGEESVWQMLLSRVRSPDPSVPLRARASANPIGPGRSWLRDRFIGKCGMHGERVYTDPASKRTRAYVPGTSKDNSFLPQSYWDGLLDLPPSIQVALKEGIWDSPLGMFYPELADDKNMARLFISKEELPPFLDWHEHWGSYDWGFAHPAVYMQWSRIKDTVYLRDSLYMHRAQDPHQATMIQGESDPRCLKLVYAGHDAFQTLLHHKSRAESVADVFSHYGINLAPANIDIETGSKVVRRFIAPPSFIGPAPKYAGITLRIVDTPGNRRVISELASLVPQDAIINKPAKRNANERGQNGDDGADAFRYGVATPTFEPQEPPPVWSYGNVDDHKDHDFPGEKDKFMIAPDVEHDGVVDKRVYETVKPREYNEWDSGI